MIIDEALAADRPQPGLPIELSTSDPLVRRAMRAMQQNIATPRSVAALADRLGVSRRKLERHFRDALGITPAAADKRIRIAQARLLLQSTAHSIARIAAETGFCDASHLIRVFRDQTGITPETFRRGARDTAGG
jgi:transcriptional regulator GlxA family with amidase domain